MESVGVLEDKMLVAGEKEIGGQQLPYIPQGKQLITWSLVGEYRIVRLAGRRQSRKPDADRWADHCADKFQIKRNGNIDVLD